MKRVVCVYYTNIKKNMTFFFPQGAYILVREKRFKCKLGKNVN